MANIDQPEPFAGWSEEDADGVRTYALKRPVQLSFRAPDGGERTERVQLVRMRRANGGDLRALEKIEGKSGVNPLYWAITRLTGLEEAALDKFDTEDLRPLGVAAMTLLEGGPVTGATARVRGR